MEHYCDGRHGGREGCKRFLATEGSEAILARPAGILDCHRWGHQDPAYEDVIKFCSCHGLGPDAFALAHEEDGAESSDEDNQPLRKGTTSARQVDEVGKTGTKQMQKDQSKRIKDSRVW